MDHFDTSKIASDLAMSLVPHPSTYTVRGNWFRAASLAFAIDNAIENAKIRTVMVERDLNRLVPKAIREHAIDTLVKADILRETTFHGKPAWSIDPRFLLRKEAA